MLKENPRFIIFFTVLIVLMMLFTFFITYSIMPHEDKVPRRSRLVSTEQYIECQGEIWNSNERK